MKALYTGQIFYAIPYEIGGLMCSTGAENAKHFINLTVVVITMIIMCCIVIDDAMILLACC